MTSYLETRCYSVWHCVVWSSRKLDLPFKSSECRQGNLKCANKIHYIALGYSIRVDYFSTFISAMDGLVRLYVSYIRNWNKRLLLSLNTFWLNFQLKGVNTHKAVVQQKCCPRWATCMCSDGHLFFAQKHQWCVHIEYYRSKVQAFLLCLKFQTSMTQ